MGMGPITIFDKSALQALSMDEAVWFDAFFLANVVPVFYVETLADLEKEIGDGQDARGRGRDAGREDAGEARRRTSTTAS